ncbi:MAG TPA: LCP family protein, partial [Candidatus Caenarcaniphilales bacterium]|nr:LCP family protein [Candidatus Caenarcaniphilales bacterium]
VRPGETARPVGPWTPGMPATPERSGATAALLSFIFPGLGQAYLRQKRLALVFALPVLVVVGLALLQLRDGISRLALKLLDPAVALVAFFVVVGLGLWRAGSVLHAWRAARRTRLSLFLIPALVLVIAVTHGYAGFFALQIRDAGNNIFSGDPLAETGDTGLGGATGSPGSSLTPSPSQDAPPDVSYSPDPAESVEPEPTDPEPVIAPGPTPEVDIAQVDGLDDGLLNVLIAGIDWKPGRTHRLTDTMIVVSVATETGAVRMFSFPRDVANFPLYDGGTFIGRLNTFASYAQRHPERYPEGGMRALSLQLGYLLGIPIDYYASANIPGFESVVQAVGGVTVYNEKAINDTHLDFSLPVGEHRLDAKDAVRWARSRHGPGNNDFARARRQQQLLAALRKEMLQPARIADLPNVIEAVSKVLNTDFPPGQIDQLLRLAESVEEDPSGSWVFRYPEWAVHPHRSETGGRSIMILRIEKIADLSRELFGEQSLYSR